MEEINCKSKREWVEVKKSELLKTIGWQRVVENWDTCTQKKFHNIFIILSLQVLSFKML